MSLLTDRVVKVTEISFAILSHSAGELFVNECTLEMLSKLLFLAGCSSGCQFISCAMLLEFKVGGTLH